MPVAVATHIHIHIQDLDQVQDLAVQVDQEAIAAIVIAAMVLIKYKCALKVLLTV